MKILLALVAIVLLVAALVTVNTLWFRPWSLHLFFSKTFFEVMADQPESLTAYGVAEKYGYRRHNGHLDDLSEAYVQKRFTTLKRVRAHAEAYDTASLGAQDRLSLRILKYWLDDAIAGEPFAFHDYPVNQLFGVQSETPDLLVNLQPLADNRDAGYYVSRLEEWPRKFAQLEEGLRLRAARGIRPPRFVFDRVRVQMEQFISAPAAQNVLVTAFDERLSHVKRISPDRRAEWVRKAAERVETHVYPAYRKLLATWNELAQGATDEDGVWKLPNGDAYYAWLLRSQTTTNLTPDEIHAVGLAEVARIESEMRSCLDALGHTCGTPAEWLRTLSKYPRFLYPNTEEGRADALARYKAIADEAMALAPKYFGRLPKAPLEVRRIPEFKEAGSPGAYYMQPSMDGSRPGVFYANLRDMNDVEQFSMKTLTFHEAVPGHHFQLSIAGELADLPIFRRTLFFTAYGEGWALYSENLAVEMGLYSNDEYGNLGRLRDEMFRAVRLVVDTGIHAKRWTRQQAIDYMASKTGQAEGEVVSEIERYIVMPAQACTYKIGMLHIQKLRAEAEARLGAKFDLRAFHDSVLENGALPLGVLDEVVEGGR